MTEMPNYSELEKLLAPYKHWKEPDFDSSGKLPEPDYTLKNHGAYLDAKVVVPIGFEGKVSIVNSASTELCSFERRYSKSIVKPKTHAKRIEVAISILEELQSLLPDLEPKMINAYVKSSIETLQGKAGV